MLQCFTYALESEEMINYQMSSLFHGALIELLPESVTNNLHQPQLHPFTQHLERRDNRWFWVITALSSEMGEMLSKALHDMKEIEIRRHNMTVSLLPDSIRSMSDEDLKTFFYQGSDNKYVTVRFLTPTSFKRSGEYLIFPDLFCFYQSLMNKQDAVCDEGYLDLETLEELVNHSQIVRYRLNSTTFSLEGVRIPSFIGSMTIRLGSTATMRRFANMLFAFGEYSGVGIKTALGMGAIAIEHGSVRRTKE